MDTVLITVDALRPDHLSQYGYHRDTMPILEEFLEEGGTLFENAFSNGTHTGISLPSMLSSRYLGDEPAKSGPTLPSSLPDDVTCIGVHSNTYFATRIDRPVGFDEFEDFGVAESDEERVRSPTQRAFRQVMDQVRPTVERLGVRDIAERVQKTIFPAHLIHESTSYETAAETTDRALELVDGVDGDMFLWVHYMDPHRPFCMHIDDPAYSDPVSQDEVHSLMARAGITPQKITDEEREQLIDLYDSEIRYTSMHVRRLVDGLRERGRWKNSQVVFTADHGEEFSEHGEYFHRNRPYDELIRVPLVARGPQADGGRESSQRELLDIAPTICGEYDTAVPDEFLGENLFTGEDRRVVATGSFKDAAPVVAARWGGWKYIEVGDKTELYDLTADAGELENIAVNHPDRVSAYSETVPRRLRKEGHSAVPTDVDNDVSERLADLGYLD